MLLSRQMLCYLVQLLSAVWVGELKLKLFQWVQSYSVLLQPLGDEGMSVGREVVLFLAHWELCLGMDIPTAVQGGEDVKWLVPCAVESMDALNVVARVDIHLHVRKQ